MEYRSRAVSARVQYSGGFCRWRRSSWFGKARSIVSWRRSHRGATDSSISRHDRTAISMAASVTGHPPLVQALRAIQLLADLPEEKLQWLADHSEELRYPAGEVIIKTGGPADAMYLI